MNHPLALPGHHGLGRHRLGGGPARRLRRHRRPPCLLGPGRSGLPRRPDGCPVRHDRRRRRRLADAATDPGADRAPTTTGLDLIVAAIKNASRPLIFAGAGSRDGSGNRLTELAEAINAPTFLNSRARGSLPNDHPLLGNHARSQAMAACDLLIALGVDWDFRTNYGERVNPDATVVHVDLDSDKIGWNRSVDIGIVADPDDRGRSTCRSAGSSRSLRSRLGRRDRRHRTIPA